MASVRIFFNEYGLSLSSDLNLYDEEITRVLRNKYDLIHSKYLIFICSTCKSSKWSCTANECDGECSVYGASHYTSFDGKRFDFEGRCDYVLASDGCDGRKATFRIQAENVACGTTGKGTDMTYISTGDEFGKILIRESFCTKIQKLFYFWSSYKVAGS